MLVQKIKEKLMSGEMFHSVHADEVRGYFLHHEFLSLVEDIAFLH